MACTCVAYGSGIFVAMAGSTTGVRSSDGISWSTRQLYVSASWRSIAYGNGVFVAVSSDSSQTQVTRDGITWLDGFGGAAQSVAFGNGVFVAVTQNSTSGLTSPDGITWTGRVMPVYSSWGSVAYGNGIFVAVSALNSAVAATYNSVNATNIKVPTALPASDLSRTYIKAS